jgi:hypothetical protein
MTAPDERRELIPVTIATIVLAIGLFFIWSDIRDSAPGVGDNMITSSVVTRAGATLTPAEAPTHLVVPQTTFVSTPSTVGRSAH